MITAAATALVLSASVFATGPATAAGPTVRHACAQPGRWQCRAEVFVHPTNTSVGPRVVAGDGYTASQLETIHHTTGVKPAGGRPATRHTSRLATT